MEFVLGTLPILGIAGYTVLRNNMEYDNAFNLRIVLWLIVGFVLAFDLVFIGLALGISIPYQPGS